MQKWFLKSSHSLVDSGRYRCPEGVSNHVQDPERQRHLLRLWLAPPNDRPLPEKYAEIYGGTLEVGNRGGILVPEEKLYITVDAEG